MSITLIRPKGLGLYRVVGNNQNTKELLSGGFIHSQNYGVVRYVAKLGSRMPMALWFPEPLEVGTTIDYRGEDSNYTYFRYGFSDSRTHILKFFSNTDFIFNIFTNINDLDYHVFEIVNQNNILISNLPSIVTTNTFDSDVKIPSSIVLNYSGSGNPYVSEIEYNDNPLVQAKVAPVYDEDGSFTVDNNVIVVNGRKMASIYFEGLKYIDFTYDKTNRAFLDPVYTFETWPPASQAIQYPVYLWFDETEYISWDDDNNTIITPNITSN